MYKIDLEKLIVVIKPEEVATIYNNVKSPFALKKAYKKIGEETMNCVKDGVASEIKRDPSLSSFACISNRTYNYAWVRKIRVADPNNNKGKSAGYRAITFLVAPLSKAFVLDVTYHSFNQDNITSEQKKFCNKLADDVENYYKNKGEYHD